MASGDAYDVSDSYARSDELPEVELNGGGPRQVNGLRASYKPFGHDSRVLADW
jgi:hypothetical protein